MPTSSSRRVPGDCRPVVALAFAAAVTLFAFHVIAVEPEPPAPTPTPTPARPDPKVDPALNVPGVTKVLEEQQRRPDPAAPVVPTGSGSPTPALPASATAGPGSIPGLSLSSVALPRRKVYAEGTFLQGIGGSIVRAAGGESIFVPDGASGTRREPPMILMQCSTLGRLEGSSESAAGAVVSGQVFVYMNRQYLLPTTFTLRKSEVAVAPAAPATVTASPGATSPTSDAMDVSELIKELDARRSEKRLIQPSRAEPGAESKSAEVAGGGASTVPASNGLVTEGTLIHDRRARFARIDGEPAITFDGDAQSPADPPMMILRCRSLQRLEETINKRGENLTLSVSGRVFVYAGRNYILPTLVQIEPGSDVRPLQ